MGWNLPIYALGFTALISIAFGLWGIKNVQANTNQRLNDFLLANKGLGGNSVIQLLFSTSFSLNGLLYQIWLGYTVGLWALLIQLAWAASFILLANKVKWIRNSNGLHSFLRDKFGSHTQLIAGLCSITGTTLLIGWEFNVGKATLESLVPNSSSLSSMFFILVVALICFIYTVSGGLKSNAISNTLQNVVKLVVFLGMVFFLANSIQSKSISVIGKAFLPSLNTVIDNLGLWGLVTNLAFSLVWQFVDMSAWQNIVGSSKKLNENETKKAITISGLAVFVAPGIIGTLIGIFLFSTPNISQDNIMGQVVNFIHLGNGLTFVVLIAIFFTIMSTLDGLMLASAYSFVCDVLYRKKTLDELDSDSAMANKVLILVRLALLLTVIVGTLGVVYINEELDVSLFDLTYIMVISQLTLFGPIMLGMQNREFKNDIMCVAIYTAIIIGFGSFIYGKHINSEFLMNGAGFFALLTSYLVAKIISIKTHEG